MSPTPARASRAGRRCNRAGRDSSANTGTTTPRRPRPVPNVGTRLHSGAGQRVMNKVRSASTPTYFTGSDSDPDSEERDSFLTAMGVCGSRIVVEAAGVELFSVLITRNLLILGTATTAKKAPLPDPLYVYCTKCFSFYCLADTP